MRDAGEVVLYVGKAKNLRKRLVSASGGPTATAIAPAVRTGRGWRGRARRYLRQRDAVRLFEEAYGRTFNVIEVPEAALEAQWSAAQNPFDKTFAGLMLGLARGFDSGKKPPFEQFPMKMTSPRDYVRNQAQASGELASSSVREREASSNGAAEREAELR